MKQIRIINYALNAIALSLAHVRSVFCGPCSKPALADLMENSYYNTKVYEHPNKSMVTDFCKDIWSNQGTCCDGKDAFQFTSNWLSSVKKNAKETKVIVPTF